MSKDQDQPTASDQKRRICIGKIGAPHGVKGLVKIHPYCEDVGLLEQISEYPITIKSITNKHILAEIDGVDERNGAEALRNTELFIDRDQLPEIEEEGTYYFEDLVGMACVNDAGKNAGEVVSVQNFGAGDLLEIKSPSGDIYLLPFTNAHVPKIDAQSNTITIIPLEGL